MPDVRMLVVDDEPDIRATVSAMLEIEGYDVAEASNGADALAVVEAQAARRHPARHAHAGPRRLGLRRRAAASAAIAPRSW